MHFKNGPKTFNTKAIRKIWGQEGYTAQLQ